MSIRVHQWLKIWLQLVVIPALLLAVTLPARAETNSLPPHPRLLLNAEGIAELKARIATVPWARASWEEGVSNVNMRLHSPIVLPPRGGNWEHNYVCPIHGARLQLGKKIGDWQWEHICPIGHHILHGVPDQATLDFDGKAILDIHLDYGREVLEDGLIYQVTRDEKYARRAREILLAYADRYLSYPLHDNEYRTNTDRGGRVTSQSLTESRWLTDMTQGADLIWDTLSETNQRAITDKILLPALNQVIIPRKYGIHNIQCYENSAIGLVGFLLDDSQLIHLAIDDPQYGYRQQMAKGVLEDGMWIEGSSGYHYYAIEGILPLTEAARNCGIELYGPQLKKMFDGPFALAMPDLRLPNFNDGNVSPLQSHTDLYELAFARYHDPAYAALLHASYRDGQLALLYGATNLPEGNLSIPSASRRLAASGYAILQRGGGSGATWLALKYGPHGGAHGHPDKNSFILYYRGQIIAPDAGTHAYGSPLHTNWDKTTLAHNTLVVDEKSQQPAEGKCLAFGSEHGVDFSVTDAGPIYPGVRFIRSIALLAPQLIVFVDQVQSDAPHTYDLAYHQMGGWKDLPAGDPWTAPDAPGYKCFTKTTIRRTGTNGMVLKTVMNHDASLIALPEGDPTEIITGYGILQTTENLVPLLVQRRQAQNTACVWAVSLDGAPVKLRVEDVKQIGGNALDRSDVLLVRVTAGKNAWSLVANPERKNIAARRSNGLWWRTDAAFAVPDWLPVVESEK